MCASLAAFAKKWFTLCQNCRQMPSSRDTTDQISSFTYRKETLSAADYHALARSLRQELDVPVTSLTCCSQPNTRTHKRSCIDIHQPTRTCISSGTRTHASTHTHTHAHTHTFSIPLSLTHRTCRRLQLDFYHRSQK
jgi:hypothetical protein